MPRKSSLAPLKIYLSSTYQDLRPYRETVYQHLRSIRHDVIGMEDYAAMDARPLDKCLQDVRGSDVYVGIFAWRYGYVPAKRNPGNLSITELELREARRRKKPTFLFLLHERAPWPPPMMDSFTGQNDHGDRINALRSELMSERVVSTFDGPEELAKKVGAAVYNWQVDSAAKRVTRPRPISKDHGAAPRTDVPNLWKPGSTLRVRFLENAGALSERILRIAQVWNAYANIGFVQSDAPNSEIRVTFSMKGSWSYTGTDCLDIPHDMPTLNLGRVDSSTLLEELEGVVLHEFGHALGMRHEHNNPAGNIPWDRARVYEWYSAQLGWTKDQVDDQILWHWSGHEFPFAKPFDPSSVMMYHIPDELLLGGTTITKGACLALSAGDKAFVSRLYPYPAPSGLF